MEKGGFKKALNLLQLAGRKVPAYRSFLKRRGIDHNKIRTQEDFTELPIIDKKSYIYRYPFRDLFIDRKIPPMVYASSGSSGRPTFWFRGDKQEKIGGEIHETIFKKIFRIKKSESTLVIICFSMGVWVAGNYTLAACRYVARKGYKISTITPGVEKEDIFDALRYLAPRFKNLILAGYPPFIMDIVIEALKRKIEFKNNNIKILTAGDKFSEDWRTTILHLLNIKNVHGSVVSIYGSADAAILGHETPLSIFLRRAALYSKRLYEKLFDNAEFLPALVQYHPDYVFFEEINGELILTAKTAISLVRYNIHDTGKVIDYSNIKELLKEFNLEKEAVNYGLNDWKLPFVVLKGRTDVAVTFYAINIFPEHIQSGIKDKRIVKFLSGNFIAYAETTYNSKNQKLYITLESAQGVKPSKKFSKLVTRVITDHLVSMNIEFRKLYAVVGKKALPVIKLILYGDKIFHTKRVKGVYNIKGKKPKVIL